MSLPRAVLGNGRTVMVLSDRGRIVWGALPDTGVSPAFEAIAGGEFVLEPLDDCTVSRHYIGETSVLQTLYESPTGKASVLDFLPIRRGLTNTVMNTPHARLVRVVEGHAGQMRFGLRFAPHVDGAPAGLELDANGLVCRGRTRSLLLQTEAAVDLSAHEAHGDFVLGAGEKRHFVLTALDDPDPDVPEMRATEPDWDLDGTLDYWIAWAQGCPFQGAQRQHVLKLASVLKAVWLPLRDVPARLAQELYASPYTLLAPLALAAWGWEEELQLMLGRDLPDPGSARDRLRAAWLLANLFEAQATGLVEGTLLLPVWPTLLPMAEAIAANRREADSESVRLAYWAALNAASALCEELLLPGDAGHFANAAHALGETLQDAGAASLPRGLAQIETGAAARVWDVRRELAVGGYLQARRLMDQLLQDHDVLGMLPGQHAPDAGVLALALWTAAEIYLQAAPRPARVELPGELGD
ncbi:MAG TPA: trehalase-like domain-containing protein [Oscillatoriaceae cyanobacterium]